MEPFESRSDPVLPLDIGTPGPLSAARGAGFDTFVTARLEGAGAEIAPSEAQRYRLIDQNTVTWSWSVMTNDPGRLLLDVTMDIEWIPLDGGEPIRYQLARDRIGVLVDTPFFVFGDPLSLTSIISFVVGGITTALATLLWGRYTRRLEAQEAAQRAEAERQAKGSRRRK
jgi:hypothetical protein